MNMELRWTASQSASCFCAADAVRRGIPLADPLLAEAVAEPVRRLHAEIAAAGLPEDRFWGHLLPLSAGIESNTQLVETAVRKTLGSSPRVASIVARLQGRVGDLEMAVHRAMPDLVDRVTAAAAFWQQGWNTWGPRLLSGVAELTDPQLIVPHATVVLVYPATGGGGASHLLYNQVSVEAVSADPVRELPETLRLAWLLSQLNVDLPVYSEMILAERRPLVAALAMLPAVLSAAEALELGRCDPAAVEWAMRTWRIDGSDAADLPAIVQDWWATYLDSRPAWNVALAALDRMARQQSPQPA